VKPEFDQKIVSLRRVTRVVSGGRRFSFSVALVAGDRKGRVGVGFGKATDTPLAIDKALRDAKKNMVLINKTADHSIPHAVEAKYAASVVEIRPAPGKGIVAGSSVRTVLELAGLTNVGAKLHSRSKNSANNALVAVKALRKLEHTKIRQSAKK
jgi:small subunit ribosomal protein S5